MWQGDLSTRKQYLSWMQGVQEGHAPQQATGEVVWAETPITWCCCRVRLGAKLWGKEFFGESGLGLLLSCCCCCLERVQLDSSPEGEERRDSTTFTPQNLPVLLIKSLLAETARRNLSISALSPHLLPLLPRFQMLLISSHLPQKHSMLLPLPQLEAGAAAYPETLYL